MKGESMTPGEQVKSYLLHASKLGARLFRLNVGLAWVGSRIEKHPNGSITIHDPRPFKSGIEGMSDCGGWTSVIVTPEMVGQRIAIPVYVEAKSGTGRPTREQARFIEAVLQAGGRAGVARCVEDLERIIGGG